jgi:hypothetical protein
LCSACQRPTSSDAAVEFYRHYLGEANRGNLYYQTTIGGGHSLVIAQELRKPALNDCKDNAVPFIDECGYDQAGIILQHIYGALYAPNRGPAPTASLRPWAMRPVRALPIPASLPKLCIAGASRRL